MLFLLVLFLVLSFAAYKTASMFLFGLGLIIAIVAAVFIAIIKYNNGKVHNRDELVAKMQEKERKLREKDNKKK